MKRIVSVLLIGLCYANANAWTLIGSGVLGWSTKKLTIRWSSSQCSISTAQLEAAIDSAIAAWNTVPLSHLTLERSTTETSTTLANFLAGTATETPTIFCDTSFAANQGADKDSVPALTRLGTAIPLAYGGIILNSESGALANVSNFSAERLALILAHEMGHLLGLGHSSSAKALMYYSLSGKTSLALTTDDRDGIAYLYPRNEFQNGAFGCAAVHSSRDGKHKALSWFFSLGLLMALSLLAKFTMQRRQT